MICSNKYYHSASLYTARGTNPDACGHNVAELECVLNCLKFSSAVGFELGGVCAANKHLLHNR